MTPDPDLLTWRRAVADLYATVRASTPQAGHERWCAGRDALFSSSTHSPLTETDDRRRSGLPVPTYDPRWRVVVPLSAAEPCSLTLGGDVDMVRVGALHTPWGPLDVWWLTGYAGGIFVPVRDATSGVSTYGGGRYLLDTAKGADLGGSPEAMVVDLNFLYHPSCAYNPAWSCPLAPHGNTLADAVPVGEQLPAS